MTLTELLAALEAADGPSKELDAEIAFIAGWRMAHGHWWMPDQAAKARKSRSGLWATGQPIRDVPTFTSSIDAALTLVPEGWYWQMNNGHITGSPLAAVFQDRDAGSTFPSRITMYRGANNAIAICIAALKARGVG